MKASLYGQPPRQHNAKAAPAAVSTHGQHMLHLLDRPIAFHRCFVTLTGSITAALLLSQALYWQRRCQDPEGWWYKTRDDWREETGMERYEQEGARRTLRQLQVLQEKRCGVPAQLWYRIDEDKLLALLTRRSNDNPGTAPASKRKTRSPAGGKPAVQLAENQPTGQLENHPLDGGKPANKAADLPPTLPFNTETTTETTTTTADAPSPEKSAPRHNRERGGCPQNELVFDFHLSGFSREERQRAAQLLEGLDELTAQQVLDEFNQALANKTIRKSRWAWLRQVAQTARAGTFQSTADLSARRHPSAQAATPPPAPEPSSAWRACQAQLLQEGLARADYYTYIAPLRGVQDGQALWLQAPNPIVADWVQVHLAHIERIIRPHTPLPVRVCIG